MRCSRNAGAALLVATPATRPASLPAHSASSRVPFGPGVTDVLLFNANRQLRRHARAVAIIAALAAVAWEPANAKGAGAHTLASIAVTNCDDSGPGSLRDAVAGAASGDTVDLGGLTCSAITLSSGAIEIPQDDLYIKYSPHDGPRPTIGANLQSRIFHHTGHGTLKIEGVALENGKYDNSDIFQLVDADGGCIYSAGNVHLVASTVGNCIATATRGAHAAGGAIYAVGSVTMVESIVTSSTATATAEFNTGGGVFAHGAAYVYYSTISDNMVYGPAESSLGGGLAIVNAGGAPSTISHSTIAGNIADVGGGLVMSGIANYGTSTTITNSTITGNTANIYAAAAYLRGPVTLLSSTIALNTSSEGPSVELGSSNDPVRIESSIVADNGNGASDYDIGSAGYAITVAGSNDLVIAVAPSITLPTDTISAEPMLLALADNGGPTPTLALAAGSVAIDRGDNAAASSFDQRGSGYPRIAGAAADIGAFERPTDDTIFADGFD